MTAPTGNAMVSFCFIWSYSFEPMRRSPVGVVGVLFLHVMDDAPAPHEHANRNEQVGQCAPPCCAINREAILEPRRGAARDAWRGETGQGKVCGYADDTETGEGHQHPREDCLDSAPEEGKKTEEDLLFEAL